MSITLRIGAPHDITAAAPGGRDVDRAILIPSCGHAPASRDVSAARDVPVPPDETVPSGPFAFAISWRGAEGHHVYSRGFAMTVFDDGRLQGSTTEPLGGETLPIEARFSGGADEVRQARVELEATGVGDVPAGTYHTNAMTEHHELRYRQGGRVLGWTITDMVLPGEPQGAPPPAALWAAIRVADAIVDPHLRWATDSSLDE